MQKDVKTAALWYLENFSDNLDDLRNSVHLSSYVQTTTDNAYLLDIKDRISSIQNTKKM